MGTENFLGCLELLKGRSFYVLVDGDVSTLTSVGRGKGHGVCCCAALGSKHFVGHVAKLPVAGQLGGHFVHVGNTGWHLARDVAQR